MELEEMHMRKRTRKGGISCRKKGERKRAKNLDFPMMEKMLLLLLLPTP